MKSKTTLELKMNRLTILQQIFDDFQQMSQWIIISPESYAKYYHRVEQLIEMLEVEDCGFISGFDKNNPLVSETGFKLYDRFLTLLNKKKRALKLEPVCGFTPTLLGKYFQTILSLREKTLKKYGNNV
jgi:hypothetical protein